MLFRSDDKQHMARWLDMMAARPGVQRGRALAAEKRGDFRKDQAAQNLLFRKPS